MKGLDSEGSWSDFLAPGAKNNFMKLKDKILKCLEQDEQSRNSDIRLMQMVWYSFHREKIFKAEDGRASVALESFYELPREDAIKRHRAIIQNVEGKFLPTDKEVAKQRKIREEVWLEYVRGINRDNSNPANG